MVKEKENLAFEYFEKAYRLHISGKIEEAIKAYKKSLEYYPTAKTHAHLGWALSLEKRYEEAIEECKIAIELDPDYGNPYNDIGTYLIVLNKYDEAVYWLQKTLKGKEFLLFNLLIFFTGKLEEYIRWMISHK